MYFLFLAFSVKLMLPVCLKVKIEYNSTVMDNKIGRLLKNETKQKIKNQQRHIKITKHPNKSTTINNKHNK